MPRPTRRAVLEAAAALAAVGCNPSGSRPVDGSDLPPGTGGTAADTGTPLPTGPAPIIYIYVDQLRYDALGCTGNPVVHSPNIDALATESARFSTFVTNAPSCRAARTTMMTGLPVVDHGVWENRVLPDPSLPSHVRRIRDDAGYHTMVIGKTHLHDGFGHLGQHVDKLVAWGFTDAVELPDPQQYQLESAHSDWLTTTTAKGEEDKYRRWADFIRQYTWAAGPPDLPPWNLSTEDHLDSFCARTAADFIRSYDEDAPLYLQVNFPGPHKPFDPPSEFHDAVDRDHPSFPLPILVPPQDPIAPLTQTYMISKLEPWTESSARDLRVDYYGKVGLVDCGVGLVIAALKDAGLYDASWVILHSDHGELAGDHSMTGKVLVYEGAIRVPLLVKPPGGIAGWVDDGQVDQLDMTASLLAMAGLDPEDLDGRVLLDRIVEGPSGASAHDTKPVLFENLGLVGLRTEAFKFGWDLETGRPVELYDLTADPDEIDNRVQDPTLTADLDALVDVLRGLRTLPVDTYPG